MAAEIVRGNTIAFRVTFRDPSGAVVTPSQAMLSLSFPSSEGYRRTVELPMSESAGEWIASWDSKIARAGTVYWSAHTRSTTPAAAVDGSFELVANPANPESSV